MSDFAVAIMSPIYVELYMGSVISVEKKVY